eukprot:7385445-Prymnesium_polylepis.2
MLYCLEEIEIGSTHPPLLSSSCSAANISSLGAWGCGVRARRRWQGCVLCLAAPPPRSDREAPLPRHDCRRRSREGQLERLRPCLSRGRPPGGPAHERALMIASSVATASLSRACAGTLSSTGRNLHAPGSSRGTTPGAQ